MSQEGRGSRIADDFPSIAARMRELASQPRQVAVRHECGTCENTGWVWSSTALDWRGCPRCGMSQYFPKPQPRR
jgi:ribosomal protein S27AE